MVDTDYICYCFKKTKSELSGAIETGNEKEFIEKVKALMKEPGCFCETANPSGKCCIKDINDFITATKKGL